MKSQLTNELLAFEADHVGVSESLEVLLPDYADMIIQGRFIGDAPYFTVHLRSAYFHGLVRQLALTASGKERG